MKSVLVTGAASGMGRAVAEKLAQSGYYVYACDLNKTEEMTNICQLTMDICDQQSIDAAFQYVSEQTNQLDAIINFAGIIMMNSLVEIPESQYKKIFDVNFFGAYRVNKTFLPLVLHNKGKIIITTSELAPNKIIPFNSIYSISKKALDAYAEGLRMELALLDVPVVTLRPGAVKTNMLHSSDSAVDGLVSGTQLYKSNTAKFKKIVASEQGTAIPASKIANLVLKIVKAKHPKFVYTKNASLKLKLLNLVPAKLQAKIYKTLLK